VALSFPLGYGAYDWIKNRKTNFFSILGLLNVGTTGGLALAGLYGIWFAVKEAAFPLLIGLFVFASSFSKNPFIKTLFMNPQILKIDLLYAKLEERKSLQDFERHLQKATLWLSGSFLFSAILNFILARYFFTPIDPALPAEQQSLVLNEQLANMTAWSMGVIMVPSIIFLMLIFWYLMKGIRASTGLSLEELTPS
jgi:hypothetical protein